MYVVLAVSPPTLAPRVCFPSPTNIVVHKFVSAMYCAVQKSHYPPANHHAIHL